MKSKLLQNTKAGIYLRLSNDDERTGESLSIENQRRILEKYVMEQGFELVDTYIDDGVSGTSFDRPGVQRLFEDAKIGRINVIIVKDLSRFGRNYIEVGQYTDSSRCTISALLPLVTMWIPQTAKAPVWI